ncbi:unnamed protein product [Penicillium pancosmium]
MKVEIQPYNPEWPIKFREIKSKLHQILADVSIISIEHVGSTSIPYLRAKPVIDIDIIIQPASLSAARSALSDSGYTDCGEMNVPGRFAFREPGYGRYDGAHGLGRNGELRHNTYLIIEGCLALRNHLDAKRILLEDENLREEYSTAKCMLAEGEFEDIGQYACAKTEILCKILRKAGWSEEDLEPSHWHVLKWRLFL